MKRVVAILDTMWDWRGQTSGAGYGEAPRYFRINAQNASGRLLYKLVGPHVRLLVTESCRELATSAKQHGTPDPVWLRENLQLLDGMLVLAGYKHTHQPFDVLLVCGKVAQSTYAQCNYTPQHVTVLEIPHPVARGYWTRQTIADTALLIQTALAGSDTP